MDVLALIGAALADAAFAFVACIGFALISNPPVKICLVAGVLAGLGHMTRFLLLDEGVGIGLGSLCGAILISLLSIPCARRWHTPAELFSFPALLPMIPGMFAYKTILATMQFLSAEQGPLREALLSDIFFNGLTTFFVMCGLVIGAIVPLFAFHRESILVRTIWRKAHPNEEREARMN